MTGMQRTRLEGARELDKVLKRLPQKIGQRVFTKAVREGAKVVQGEAIRNLGGDKTDILIRKVRVPGTSVTFRIGPPRSKFYLLFREFGTRPHKITLGKASLRKGKKLLVDKKTGAVFGTEVQHPGQSAEPFLRPAFDGNVDMALAAMGRVLGDEIEKAAVKLAGSFAKSGLARRKRRRR